MVQNVTPKSGYRLVYRVERSKDKSHKSDYFNKTRGNPKNGKRSWRKLPNPLYDGISNFNDKFVCGTKDLNQLALWWIIPKVANPNKIRVLAVPENEVFEGKTQVIFKRQKAKVVGKVNPDNSLTIYKYGKKFINEC